jgi:threonine/homoserine/homoserine lactone efflux protein
MTAATIFTYFSMGAFFGLTAAISPGPLLALVITETLKHNKSEGIKIAVAPLITDLPIIVITSLIFSKLTQFAVVPGIISFLGGAFCCFLGYETIKTKGVYNESQKLISGSLKKGIAANFFNPHPYIFWLTIGIPTAFKAFQADVSFAILFFISFYLFLIGSKIGIVLIVEKSKAFLRNSAYTKAMRILGTALLIFAAYFFYDSIRIMKNLI